MTDDKPDLTKTEMRQGNSRKMNSRALVFGLIALIILFALVIWFSMATYDETSTTTNGGTTVDETAASIEGPVADEPVEEAAPAAADEPAVQ